MRLFDPVLAVLSSAAGRVSFRDLYADGGGGLGQVRRGNMGMGAGKGRVRMKVRFRVRVRERVGIRV